MISTFPFTAPSIQDSSQDGACIVYTFSYVFLWSKSTTKQQQQLLGIIARWLPVSKPCFILEGMCDKYFSSSSSSFGELLFIGEIEFHAWMKLQDVAECLQKGIEWPFLSCCLLNS